MIYASNLLLIHFVDASLELPSAFPVGNSDIALFELV